MNSSSGVATGQPVAIRCAKRLDGSIQQISHLEQFMDSVRGGEKEPSGLGWLLGFCNFGLHGRLLGKSFLAGFLAFRNRFDRRLGKKGLEEE